MRANIQAIVRVNEHLRTTDDIYEGRLSWREGHKDCVAVGVRVGQGMSLIQVESKSAWNRRIERRRPVSDTNHEIIMLSPTAPRAYIPYYVDI